MVGVGRQWGGRWDRVPLSTPSSLSMSESAIFSEDDILLGIIQCPCIIYKLKYCRKTSRRVKMHFMLYLNESATTAWLVRFQYLRIAVMCLRCDHAAYLLSLIHILNKHITRKKRKNLRRKKVLMNNTKKEDLYTRRQSVSTIFSNLLILLCVQHATTNN